MSQLVKMNFTKHTGPKHTATIIFFHGSGATGEHMKDWVGLMAKNFNFPHIKVAFPTAPLQPYTPSRGMESNVWFDRKDINPHVPEFLESINQIQPLVQYLIQQENDAGIPNNRIAIGGFSMGGALAMYTGYLWQRDVAGVFAYSSFLNNNSVVYKDLKDQSPERTPPLLQMHGDRDDLVDIEWGQATFNELQACSVQGEFHVLERLGHTINKNGMKILKEWIDKLLPE